MKAVPAMDGLLGTVIALVRFGASQGGPTVTRIPAMALLGAFAALAAAGVIGCLIAALWIFTAPQLGPAAAALVAAAALGLCTLVLVASLLLVKHRARRPSANAPDWTLLRGEAKRLWKDDKAALLLTALIAGLLTGHQSRD